MNKKFTKLLVAIFLFTIPAKSNAAADMAGIIPNFAPPQLLEIIQGAMADEMAPAAPSLVGSSGDKLAINSTSDGLWALFGENVQAAVKGGAMVVDGNTPSSSMFAFGAGVPQNVVNLLAAGEAKKNESSFASQKNSGSGNSAPKRADAHRAFAEHSTLLINNYGECGLFVQVGKAC